MRNLTFKTNKPAIIEQAGELESVAGWEASKPLSEREIVMDFFRKAIAILDKTNKEVKTKYPRMFKK